MKFLVKISISVSSDMKEIAKEFHYELQKQMLLATNSIINYQDEKGMWWNDKKMNQQA